MRVQNKIIILGNGSSLVSTILTKNLINLAPKLNFEILAVVDANKKNKTPLILKYLFIFIQKVFNPFDKITLDVFPHFFYYIKGIKKIKSKNINSASFIEEIEKLNPDYAIVVGVGQIMKNEIISKFKKILNYHNSYLPTCGGLYATSWEMYKPSKNSGFTYHYIEDEQIDSGNILLQQKHKVDINKTPLQNEIEKTHKANDYLLEALTLLKDESAGVKQRKTVSYYSMKHIKRIRGIESLDNINEIKRRIHCFNYVIYKGCKITKIDNAGKIKRVIYLPVFIFKMFNSFKRFSLLLNFRFLKK